MRNHSVAAVPIPITAVLTTVLWWNGRHTGTGKRNLRDVWSVATQGTKEAHFATFPEKLIEPCILAGTKAGDVVLDPFAGSGTTGIVAHRYGREFIGIELNEEYAELARRRISDVQMRLVL